MPILFAHGAGVSSSSPWMRAWTERLSSIAPTVSFDYPYMREGRRAPDPLPKLVAAHREALRKLASQHGGPLVLAGKSMGSRVGCHVALEEPTVSALVCFGYPLSSAGKKKVIRDEVLLQMKTPIMFIQGSRDPLCSLDRLEEVRKKMKAPTFLHVVEGGNHSLLVSAAQLKMAGEKQADADGRVLAAVRSFIQAQAPA
jgi:predicted alpha/beta-hydrolase family hydrolase